MADHLKTHPLFRNMTEEQGEDMMDGIEKHLMTNIYTKYALCMLRGYMYMYVYKA